MTVQIILSYHSEREEEEGRQYDSLKSPNNPAVPSANMLSITLSKVSGDGTHHCRPTTGKECAVYIFGDAN